MSKLPKWVSDLSERTAKAKADPRIPKGYWARWRLFFVTLWKCIKLLPAASRGARVVRSIERQQNEAERDRIDRLRNPDRYRI